MSTRASTLVDSEDIETTKSEKLLAVVLVVFMLIGGIWTYEKIDDWVAQAVDPTEVASSPAEDAAVARLNDAQFRLERATDHEVRARSELELRREEYRTALDAGEPASRLEREYSSAQATFGAARAERLQAEQAVAAARPAGEAALRRYDEAFQDRDRQRQLWALGFRLAFVVAMIAAGYWLIARLRRRRSRYLPLGLAFVGFATVLAVVLASDYLTDYVDPRDFGPLILALFGIVATIAAFVALQRYLARRIPIRRVRKQECPFCGYPTRGGAHCEGCGRPVVAECAHCSRPRRVGTIHCAACGRA
jgi:hypothetical protein